MGRFLRAVVGISLAAIGACEGGQPPTSPPPSSGAETITGRERLGWSQSAESPADFAFYQYAVYVDGARRVLQDAVCGAPNGLTAECTAPLPPLSVGAHTLQVAAFLMSGGTVVEGPLSATLQVTVTSVIASPVGERPDSGIFSSSDGLRLAADILANDLDDPIDLAVDDEARVFVAERRRGIRIIDANPRAPLIDRDDHVSFLSVALAPDFRQSHFVYVAFATIEREQPLVRIARFREVRGQLAEAAVITSQAVDTADTSAVIRFGPDGALFVGIAAESNPDDAQRLASPAGKVLRLRGDGSTPEDNPMHDAVFSYGHRDPRGFAWHARSGLWEVERSAIEEEINVLQPGGNYGWPQASIEPDRIQTRPRWARPRVTLPSGTEASGLTTIGQSTHPLYGDLIVSAQGARDLLRIRLTPDGHQSNTAPARLLQARFGRIGQVTSAADGTLYFVTANRETWGAGSDMLVRLSVLQ